MRLPLRVATAVGGSCVVAILAVSSCSNGDASTPPPDTADSSTGFHVDSSVLQCADGALACMVAAHVGSGSCQGSEPSCHGGSDNPAGLYFHGPAENDLKQLVNVPSSERPDWMRVNPYHPEISWLVAKLRNDKDAGVEVAMPKGSDGDPKFAALVEAWILAGAPTSLDVPDASDASVSPDSSEDSDSSDGGSDADAGADIDADVGSD